MKGNLLSLFSTIIVLVPFLGPFTEAQQMFSNPIFDHNSADPSVVKIGEFYYLTLTTAGETQITIYKSSKLTDFRNAETIVAYQGTPTQHNLWASEMHEVDGELYIYFTMSNEGDGQKMHVIQADDRSNPMGNWGSPIKLMADFEDGIDGTVLKHGNGQKYFAWASTWGIWIARMENATFIDKSKLRLRLATEQDWACDNVCLNEGPYFIYNRGVSYLIFSAGSTFYPNYVLGMMSIEGDKDPMVPSNWWYGPNGPVFWRNDEEDVYTTGHATFTTSPDETETWMVYHASNSSTFINGNRVARIEKIEWSDVDGRPIFPRPHGYNHLQPVPSGQV